MKTRNKKMIFVGLLALLALETVVVFFQWSLFSGVFWALAVLVFFYPQKTWELFFPLSIGLAVATVLSVAVSQDGWASHLAFGLFHFLVLLTEGLVVIFWKKNAE